MKDKEDVLNERSLLFYFSKKEDDEFEGKATDLYAAMEEYAKEVAIDFANWSQNKFWEKNDDGLWYKWMMRMDDDKELTSEELFELYLIDKQKQSV